MAEVRKYFNPEVGLRLAVIPDVLRVWYTAPAAGEIPHMGMDSLMGGEFRLTRCRHDDNFQFTPGGFRAFVEAAKAGEFDHLLEEVESGAGSVESAVG